MLAVTLVTLAALAAWTVHDAESGPLRSAEPGRGKPVRPAQFGFALGGDAHELAPAVLARELATIRRAGGRWVRFDVNWALIQIDGPRSYHWDNTDRLVAEARRRGLKVLLTVIYTPPWARPADEGGLYGPDPKTYARFVKQVAKRYAPRGVHHYEIWNEPNHPPFFYPRPNPRRYAAMLKAVYPRVHRADPKATVITGGTAPGVTHDTAIGGVDFLAALYANGAGDSFDAVGQHPSTFPGLPGERRKGSPWYQMYGTRPSLRGVMRRNGDAGKKIWATEWGVPTNGPAGTFVTEARQAKLYGRAIRLWSTYPWAGKLIAYQLRDAGTGLRTRENFWGILRRDFTAKPAVELLRRLVARRR